MYKKKLKRLLFILLLVFCLTLSTKCYASFTESDIKNLAYNRLLVKFTAEEAENICNKLDLTQVPTSTGQVLDLTYESNNNKFVAFAQANLQDIYFLILNDNEISSKYIRRYDNDTHKFFLTGHNYLRLRCTMSANNIDYVNWDCENLYLNQDINIGWYYTQFDIYAKENSSNLMYSANSSNPSNWQPTEGPYIDQTIYFNEAPTNTHITLLNKNNIPLYNYAYGGFKIGDLVDVNNSMHQFSDYLEFYYWHTDNWYSYSLMDREFINSKGEQVGYFWNNNRFLNILPNALFTNYEIYLKPQFQFKNVLYHYQIKYKDYNDENYQEKTLNIYWYVGDSNTTILDGTIDIPNTIKDPSEYVSQFTGLNNIINNNNNTDAIINNIESGNKEIVGALTDDSETDNILDDFLSGDSVDSLATNLGLDSVSGIQNPFTSIIYNVFMGIIGCFESTEDITLDFGYGGRSYIVHASEFVTPENNTIIVLIKYSLIFGYVYGIVWFYYRSIENLKHLGDKGINILVGSIREDAAFDWRLL